MVVQESALLARAFAEKLEMEIGRKPPVFFVGGLIVDNKVGQRTIASTFTSLGLASPMFLRHAYFLGALGSLGTAAGLQSSQTPLEQALVDGTYVSFESITSACADFTSVHSSTWV